MEIKGKKTVITGASSGIGHALLEMLLDAGAIVVAASRNIEQLGLSHERLFVKNCDVSRKEDIDALFDFTLGKLNDIDLFVANAGFAYYEQIEEPNWNHIQHIFHTNTVGLIYSAQKMKQIKGDNPYNFVCTASAMSFLSVPGYALYSSTKAAIRGFADAYRYELHQGQIFQVVYPVATKTNFFQAAGEDPPVPWPTQTAEQVAGAIFKGIRKNKLHIFPSKLFQITNFFNGIIPLVGRIYAGIENKKLQEWSNTK